MVSSADLNAYTYDDLQDWKQPLRLLKLLPRGAGGSIHCRLSTYHSVVGIIPCYVALSYTWGSGPDSHSIWLNGKRFAVRENLFSFLENSTNQIESMPALLWIDAICINQRNAQEKEHQVARMATVFAKAEYVLVWLGPAYFGSNEIMQELCHLDPGGSEKAKAEQICALSCQNLLALCLRSYWSRLWIFQELMLARSIVLMCGDHQVSWDRFLTAIHDSRDVRKLEDRTDQYFFFQRTWESPALAIIKEVMTRDQSKSLFDLIFSTSHLKCEDVKDKIYALLGIAKTGLSDIRPDYTRQLTNVLNDVLRNYHLAIPPETTKDVEEQCQKFEAIFRIRLGKQFCDEATTIVSALKKPSSETLIEFPLVLPNTSLSLWWTVSYGHCHITDLLLHASIAHPPSPALFPNSYSVRAIAHLENSVFFKALFRAVDRGNSTVIKILLSANVIVSNLGMVADGNELVHRAIRSGQLDLIRVLVTEFASLNSFDSQGLTPLTLACQRGDVMIVKELLKSDRCDINRKDSDGYSPLRRALEGRKPEVILCLLQRRDCRLDDHFTLNVVISLEDDVLLRCLVDHPMSDSLRWIEMAIGKDRLSLKKDLSAFQISAMLSSPSRFLAAVLCADHQLVDRLLQKESSYIHERTQKDHFGALHLAVLRGDSTIVRALLDRQRADLNALDFMGRTPFQLAVELHQADIVALFMKTSGIDANLHDPWSRPPIHTAVEKGFNVILNHILTISEGNSCNVNAVDSHGQTPLHVAIAKGNIDATQMLARDSRCDVNAVDLASQTPLHVAALKGDLEAVRVLVQCPRVKLDVAGGSNNLLPHGLAKLKGHDAVADFLLDGVKTRLALIIEDRDLAPTKDHFGRRSAVSRNS